MRERCACKERGVTLWQVKEREGEKAGNMKEGGRVRDEVR